MASREKFPDLIGQTPAKQKKGLPPIPAGKCGKRNKTCSVHGDGCGYRFKAGDKHWVCPKCGADRRCWSNRIKDGKTCRMHGAKGGTANGGGGQPGREYAILENLHPNYNAILRSEKLLENSQHIAALDSLALTLIEEMKKYDYGAALDDLQKSYSMISAAHQYGNTSRIRAGLDMFLEAMAPLRSSYETRQEYYEIVMVRDRLINSQFKRMMENKQMVPWVQVMEFANLFVRIMFKHVRDQPTKTAIMNDIRPYFRPDENGNAS